MNADVETVGPYLMFDGRGNIRALSPHHVVRDYDLAYDCELRLDAPESKESLSFWNLCASGSLDEFTANHLLKNRPLKTRSVIVLESDHPPPRRVLWCIRVSIGVRYEKREGSSSSVKWSHQFLWPVPYETALAASNRMRNVEALANSRLCGEWAPTPNFAASDLVWLPLETAMCTMATMFTALTIGPGMSFNEQLTMEAIRTAPPKEPYITPADTLGLHSHAEDVDDDLASALDGRTLPALEGLLNQNFNRLTKATIKQRLEDVCAQLRWHQSQSVRYKIAKSVGLTRAKAALYDKCIIDALDHDMLDAVVRHAAHECYRKMSYDLRARVQYGRLRQTCKAFRDIVADATICFYCNDYAVVSNMEQNIDVLLWDDAVPQKLVDTADSARQHFVGTGHNAAVLLGHIKAYKRQAGFPTHTPLEEEQYEELFKVAEAQAPQRFKELFMPTKALARMLGPGGAWGPVEVVEVEDDEA